MNLFYPKKKKKSCTMNPFLLCDKKNCNIVQYHMASGDTHYDCIFFFLIKNIVKSFGVVKLKQENLKEESEYRTEACLKIIYI